MTHLVEQNRILEDDVVPFELHAHGVKLLPRFFHVPDLHAVDVVGPIRNLVLDAVRTAKCARSRLQSRVVLLEAPLIHQRVLHACSPVMVRGGRLTRQRPLRAIHWNNSSDRAEYGSKEWRRPEQLGHRQPTSITCVARSSSYASLPLHP